MPEVRCQRGELQVEVRRLLVRHDRHCELGLQLQAPGLRGVVQRADRLELSLHLRDLVAS